MDAAPLSYNEKAQLDQNWTGQTMTSLRGRFTRVGWRVGSALRRVARKIKCSSLSTLNEHPALVLPARCLAEFRRQRYPMPSEFPVSVTLSAAPEGDTPINSVAYQAELAAFKAATKPKAFTAYTVDSVDGGGHLTGFFSFQDVKLLLEVLAPVAIAFIARTAGRKVKLRIGDVEAEARNVEEVAKLLALAKAHAKRSQAPTPIPDRPQSYWLGFVSENGAKDVKQFDTEAKAIRYREASKAVWQIPAQVTTVFQAATREEALEKMDRY